MNKIKSEIVRNLLEQGINVYIHLDSRKPGCVLPRKYADLPHVTLVFGRRLNIPIPDITITHDGISGTLHFPEFGYVHCTVPWDAVWAISQDSGAFSVWETEVPEGVHTKMRNPPEPAPAGTAVHRGHLRLIRGGRA